MFVVESWKAKALFLLVWSWIVGMSAWKQRKKTPKGQDPVNVIFQNADRTYLVQPGKLKQRSRDQLLQFLRCLIGQKRKARQQQISLKVDPLDESIPPVGPNPSHSTLVDRREEIAPLQQVRERRRARRAVGRRDRQVRLEEESEVVRQDWSGEKGYEFCLRLKDGRLGWLFDREGRTSCTPIRARFGALGVWRSGNDLDVDWWGGGGGLFGSDE